MTRAAQVTHKGARKPEPRGAGQSTITSFLEPEEAVSEPEQVDLSEPEQVEQEPEEVVLPDERSDDETAAKPYFSPGHPSLRQPTGLAVSITNPWLAACPDDKITHPYAAQPLGI